MKLVTTVVLLLSLNPAYAQPKTMQATSTKGPQAIVGQSTTGQLTYFVPGPDGQLKEVSLSFFNDGLEKAVAYAKKVVCEMNVLPQSVTVSSVVVSVTYDTKQFCPSKK